MHVRSTGGAKIISASKPACSKEFSGQASNGHIRFMLQETVTAEGMQMKEVLYYR